MTLFKFAFRAKERNHMIISQNETTIIPKKSIESFDAFLISEPYKDIDYYILYVIIKGIKLQLGLFKNRSDAYYERENLIKYLLYPESSKDYLIKDYD